MHCIKSTWAGSIASGRRCSGWDSGAPAREIARWHAFFLLRRPPRSGSVKKQNRSSNRASIRTRKYGSYAMTRTGINTRNYPASRCMPWQNHSRHRAIKELTRTRFDIAFGFWTGEKQYRRWKLLGFRLRAKKTYIIGGDGNEFRLTWKAICRHSIFRFRHPLPTDHRDYVEQVVDHVIGHAVKHVSEEILVIQSAEPGYVFKALGRLEQEPVFTNPSFTIFCRNRPEILGSFQGNPLFKQVLSHSEARGSWNHLRSLRRKHFDGIVLFLTGDPSYWKVKLFAFLLGSRRILIFNEANDCFFFNLHQWLALISHRIQGGCTRTERSTQWSRSTRILLSLILKSVFLPFRFLWLLLVWLRLRVAGLGWSRKSHDCSL